MPKSAFKEMVNHIEIFVGTEFPKIKHDHGGEFIACLESGRYVLGDCYLELIHKLEDEDVDLTSVQVAKIPEEG